MSSPKSFHYSDTGALWGEMDPIFEDQLGRELSNWPVFEDLGSEFDLDVCEELDHVIVRANLPGLDYDDIYVNLDQNWMTIYAAFPSDSEDQTEDCGKYQRTVSLPASISPASVHIVMTGGVLEVSVPKAERK